MNTKLVSGLLILAGMLVMGAEKTPVPKGKITGPDAAWKKQVADLAPENPRVKPKAPRKVLLFSLATGYCHAVIPHVKAVMDQLAQTGAFEVTHSVDIASFDKESLQKFDAIVLNNTCTKRPARNMFLDALASRKELSAEQRQARAVEFEKDLTEFVASGKGLMLVHGAIVFLNESPEFGKLVGGSFVMHPKMQKITLSPVEPGHPLVAAFKGEEFIHYDEPYLFNRAYEDKNFRPLLEMKVDQLDDSAKKKMAGDRRFVSWIKPHGKGRVIYISPSHQPESYLSSRMLQFYLDGLQYVIGDLKVDDSVAGKK